MLLADSVMDMSLSDRLCPSLEKQLWVCFIHQLLIGSRAFRLVCVCVVSESEYFIYVNNNACSFSFINVAAVKISCYPWNYFEAPEDDAFKSYFNKSVDAPGLR